MNRCEVLIQKRKQGVSDLLGIKTKFLKEMRQTIFSLQNTYSQIFPFCKDFLLVNREAETYIFGIIELNTNMEEWEHAVQVFAYGDKKYFIGDIANRPIGQLLQLEYQKKLQIYADMLEEHSESEFAQKQYHDMLKKYDYLCAYLKLNFPSQES